MSAPEKLLVKPLPGPGDGGLLRMALEPFEASSEESGRVLEMAEGARAAGVYGLPAGAEARLRKIAASAGGVCCCEAVEGQRARLVLCGGKKFWDELAAGLRAADGPEFPGAELARRVDRAVSPGAAGAWRVGGGRLMEAEGPPLVMGVLNITPDSFYSGSRIDNTQQAVETAGRMLEEGADILDIGGESTRPGAGEVGAEEESRRVLPVIRAVVESYPRALVSVDTCRAAVAREAVGMGAHIVNDISGGARDPEMFAAVAAGGAGYVMMHMRGTPATMQSRTGYTDLLAEIAAFFERMLERAGQEGLDPERVALDPGIGFAKRREDNYVLIRRLGELGYLGRPLMAGPSRKSFMALAGLEEPGRRLEGTIVACVFALLAGARILRVHDVGPVKRALAVAGLFGRA